jgi:plasmid maintenance system antidote protein VapI
MKINIIKPDQPSELQKLIAGLPFDAASEAEYKGLMLVEELLVLMKEQGINRTVLAKRMGIGSPRVTAMLNGSSNFTLETLIRAAHAVGATLQQTLVPEGTVGRWSVYREDEIHTAFQSRKNHIFANPPFQLDTDEIATDDDAKSA